MSELLTAYLEVQVERVPDLKTMTDDELRVWVVAKGFHRAGAPKYAWIPQLDCFIRGADYLVYIDGELADTALEEDVIWARPGGKGAACSASQGT